MQAKAIPTYRFYRSYVRRPHKPKPVAGPWRNALRRVGIFEGRPRRSVALQRSVRFAGTTARVPPTRRGVPTKFCTQTGRAMASQWCHASNPAQVACLACNAWAIVVLPAPGRVDGVRTTEPIAAGLGLQACNGSVRGRTFKLLFPWPAALATFAPVRGRPRNEK